MILVCPKCGTENPIPDRYGPSKIYRCDNCNFLLEDIRKLSDNELMILDSRLTAQVISEDMQSYSDHYRGPDFTLLAAVTNEVNRRFGAASWFWRRWRKPLYEYKELIPAKATRVFKIISISAGEYCYRQEEGDLP